VKRTLVSKENKTLTSKHNPLIRTRRRWKKENNDDDDEREAEQTRVERC